VARPTVSEPTEQLYSALGPLTAGDEERDWPLLRICEALIAAFVEQIWQYVSDTDDGLGWTLVMDPNRTPADALPWLGQFAGVELFPGQTEDERRAAIRDPAGFQRGTRGAMYRAVRATLTGAKTVQIHERVGGDAYHLAVETLPGQTPDPAVTLNAILSQKPIGLVLDVSTPTGQTWADVVSKHANWLAVDSTYPDWIDVITTVP
jgi:hypothetical protein